MDVVSYFHICYLYSNILLLVLPKNASSHKNQQILSVQQKIFLDRMNRIFWIIFVVFEIPRRNFK
jgi:hypothetical protein